ncbi:MAG TPA: hypothetical protein VG711_05655 [Phycisphaerales bacterium]|nr:hypothetical protein [Phycisphaerales bacterium]
MLNVKNITKLCQHEAWPRIIDRILANGRLPAANPDIFKHPAVIQQAALALALLRSCELSYGLDPITPTLLSHLLANQHEDGLFVRADICNRADLFSALERTQPSAQRARLTEESDRITRTDSRARLDDCVRTNPSIDDHDLLFSALATTAIAATALSQIISILSHPETSGINAEQVQNALESALSAISRNFSHLSESERNLIHSFCSAPDCDFANDLGSANLAESVAASAPISRTPSSNPTRPRKPHRFSAAA